MMTLSWFIMFGIIIIMTIMNVIVTTWQLKFFPKLLQMTGKTNQSD